jgi:hypothetical protein
MESLELNDYDYNNIQGTNDLEMIDNISKRRKKKLEKKIAAGKFKGKKLARKKAIASGKKMTLFGKIAGVATGGASLMASKAGRAAAKKGVKAIAGMTVLLPLQPLRPMMVKRLKKEGVSVSNKTALIDLANLFYNKVVRKKDSSFEEIDLNNISDYDDHVVGAAIGAVVSGILAFIKGIKKKKKAGEKLDAGDELIEAGVAVIEKQIEEKQGEPITDEPVDENGNMPIDSGFAAKMGVPPMVLYAAIALVVIIIIVLLVRRKK